MIARFFQPFLLLAAAFGVPLALSASNAAAQPAEAQAPAEPLEYPSAPERWLNYPPLSSDMLQGKAVFLWFFEEGCPSCAAKWPDLIALSQQHQDKPIVFIGVNSGTPRGALQTYIQRHRVSWPVIVDADRSFERLCGVNEISLQNIYQVRYVTADGNLHSGRWNDLAGTIEKSLEGATWRVDPSSVPDELKQAWFHVEIGNFVSAGPPIRRSVGAKNEAIRSAAQGLLAAVERELAEQVTRADEALAAQDTWLAYRRYDDIARRFRGYNVPPQVAVQLKSLASDDTVASQLKARKQLDAAQKTGSRGTPAAVKRAIVMLEKLVESYPGTEAAREAEELLAKIGGGS